MVKDNATFAEMMTNDRIAQDALYLEHLKAFHDEYAEELKAQEELKRELNNRLLEIDAEHFATVDELAAERLEKELETLAMAHENKLLSEEDYLLQKAMLEQKYMEESADRAKEFADKEVQIEKAKQAAKMNALTMTFGNLSSLMNTENRKLFEIGKAAAIAQATISTYQGAAQALKDIPYPFNIAAAASVGVAGAVQIANIKSTSLGSGGAVAAGVPGGSTPSGMTPTQTVGNNQNAPAGGTLTVQGLSAASLFSGDAVAQIAEELLDYQKRGGNVVLQG
jgi:hypothetical protein